MGDNMTHEDMKKLAYELIDLNKCAMVTTNGKGGFPYTRIMKVMKKDGLKEFVFVTRKDSNKIKQIKKSNKGSVYFYDEKNYHAVMFLGRFKITENNMFGIPNIYTIDPHDPFEYVVMIFKLDTMRVYNHYKTDKEEL
jgi:hypothetical protein